MNYATAMASLLKGEPLDRPAAESLMGALLDGGLSATQVAAVLTALAAKDASVEEMTGFATVMRARARSVSVPGDPVDTCGTGGSGLSTLNTSTMVAFMLAAGGAKVVKHGNRASSGKCGSMDVLERLGINVDVDPEQAQSIAQDSSFVFLNARKHHPALGPLAPIRKDLGFRTVFNLLGPLCNPAGVKRQLLGVSDARHAETIARTLRALGVNEALVVCGADGLDELSLHGPSRLWHVRGDRDIEVHKVLPEDVGLTSAPLEALEGGDVDCNARWFETILRGEDDGPRTHHTLLNAGAAFWVAGLASSLADGVTQARAVLTSGQAFMQVEVYRERTNQAPDAS
jgi:anthranilate phosphoribosyltransferase